MLFGKLGNAPIFTVTAAVVPGVRVTVKISLSTLPTGIVMFVVPPLMLPFVTVIGRTISKGAPVGTTALNWFSLTFSSEILIGSGLTVLSVKSRRVRLVRPEKMLSGNELKLLLLRISIVSVVSPSKISDGNELNSLPAKLSAIRAVSSSKISDGNELNSLPSKLSAIRAVSSSKTPDGNEPKSL